MKNFTIVALCVLCVWLTVRGCGGQTDRIVEQRDTTVVVRVDTIVHTKVAYRDRWRVRVDTLRVWVGGDSVSVPIPIDKHIFTDDTTYRAEVSGFNVSLDRMEVFRPTIERTITASKSPAGRRKQEEWVVCNYLPAQKELSLF